MPGIAETMREFKAEKLHSGSKSGPVVENRKQAIAIALSEQRKGAGAKSGPTTDDAAQALLARRKRK